MPKKSLQEWYNSNDITYSQKEIIKKFGVGDYYPECVLRDLKKLWYFNEILIRNGYKLEGSFGSNSIVHYMIFFSADWNNNLILVISGEESSLKIDLIVYEMPSQRIREVFEVFCVDIACRHVDWAKSRAREIKESLRNETHPIRSIALNDLRISYHDDYNSLMFPAYYGDVCSGKKMLAIKLPFSEAKEKPDEYIKPLDIVKIFIPSRYNSNREGTRHTGIYLGNRKICHLFLVDRATKKFEIMIEDWDELFEVFEEPEKVDKIIRYHPVIPFKHKNKIIEHIAKSVTKTDGYYPRQSKMSSASSEHNSEYNINNNNCEHMVNKCALGIDFSELADRKNGKSSREINTQQNLDKTNEEFDKKYNYKGSVSEIKGYGEQAFDVNRDGINMYDSFIEVQPKSSIFKDMIREYLYRQSQ